MKIGTIINSKYQVLEEIGEGGMGLVFKVKDIVSGKFYALKGCKYKDPGNLKRFKREAETMRNTKHKNLISIIDSDLTHVPPYFVMPLARGNVNSIIPLIANNFEKVLLIFEEVCNGVIALHSSGKYHRDIKPSNFLVMKDNSVVVSDLGLVKVTDPGTSIDTPTGRFIGTHGYDAPEQANGKSADIRTDVFQLGKAFYQMYTGEFPSTFDSKKLGSALTYILNKATNYNPNFRYQTVLELLDALRDYRKSIAPSSTPKDALRIKLIEMKNELQQGLQNDSSCIMYLQLLEKVQDDPGLLIKSFDKIPDDILKIYAERLHKHFLPIFEIYTTKMKELFSNQYINFEYAETVADKMATIFLSTSNTSLRGLAIKNTLRVAVWCNRYNAMNTFNLMLQKVKDNQEAVIVADILKEEINLYKKLADQVLSSNLNLIIADVRENAVKLKLDEEKGREEDRKKILDDIFSS